MTLVAIPNVSEGRDRRTIKRLTHVVTARGARILDLHSDVDHGRSVLTLAGEGDALVAAATALAREAASSIDLTEHEGVHPRTGALDICPFVPHDVPMNEAVEVAHSAGAAIGAAGIPVYFYGAAARRAETRELPALRRGGLAGLLKRAREGLLPDEGPDEIDPRTGVVCVGARDPLIAFNVWLRGSLETARTIANVVRAEKGRAGVRALAFELPSRGLTQLSMNLTDPAATGVEAAYESVERAAREHDATVVATELVGLVPQRYLPGPDAEAAGLLIEPGRSLEAELLR
ncbi:MAG: glutamate formimidoyltransferase [Actinomycetota bacterium]|nr:glutamate formimidoyltransferase [Actinomycetota bacterium]